MASWREYFFSFSFVRTRIAHRKFVLVFADHPRIGFPGFLAGRSKSVLFLSLVQILFVQFIFALSFDAVAYGLGQFFQSLSLLDATNAQQTTPYRLGGGRQLSEGTFVSFLPREIGQTSSLHYKADPHFEFAPVLRVLFTRFAAQRVPDRKTTTQQRLYRTRRGEKVRLSRGRLFFSIFHTSRLCITFNASRMHNACTYVGSCPT